MISIIVVTYNRESFIKGCINSILSQDFNGELEVIAIDNGSSDNTLQVLKSFTDQRIKFIANRTRISLSACKNLGLQLSRGNIIAFTDDDCLVSKDWLINIKDSLNYCDFVGGVVLPVSGIKFPWWWRKSLDWLIGINVAPNKKFLPLGSNIAFKKHVLQKLQDERRDLSVNDKRYLPYVEDNYRIKKALSMGFSMQINPNIKVYHLIPKQRLRISYLIKRSIEEGYAQTQYKTQLKDIIFAFVLLPVNLIRLLLWLDLNYFFRIIVTLSYIINYIKNEQRCIIRYS